MRVPEDVAVIGDDDVPYAAYLGPALTSIRLPYGDMARAATGWLVAAARGRHTELLQAIYAPKLIVRESA